MSLVMPNQGEVLALKALLNHTAPQDLDLCLFTNNATMANSNTESSFTEIANDTYGYALVELTAANWTVTGGSPTSASYAKQTFTFTGAQGNVYGYMLLQRTSGKLVWAEKFSDGPYNVANNGDKIEVTPVITAASVTSD